MSASRSSRSHWPIVQLPSAWSYYSPTRYDVGVFVGTIGMFLMFFLLFFRFLPVVAMSEVKGASPQAHAGKGGH